MDEHDHNLYTEFADRRLQDRRKSAELMERILNQYETLSEKFDIFSSKYAIPLEYIKTELERKKRRDEFIDRVQENVTIWLIVAVLTGIAGGVGWALKVLWKHLQEI